MICEALAKSFDTFLRFLDCLEVPSESEAISEQWNTICQKWDEKHQRHFYKNFLIFFFLNGIIEYGSLCKYIVLVIESKIYENKVTLKPYCTIIEREICSCATKERSINFGRLLGINFFTKCIKTPGKFWMKLLLKYFSIVHEH